jgi:hypothetical protein
MKIDDLNNENEFLGEVRRILEEAEKLSPKTMNILFEDDELKDIIDKSIQNPDEAYNLYHRRMNKLLRENFYPLMEGKENLPNRQLIYDQKNLLLNFGKDKDNKGIRGSDGKMTTTERMQMVADLILEWVISDGKTPFNLFTKLRDKNIELGYITKKDTNK